ncbi:MAG: enoyl-CoA hydratase-related protein, partial [Myxococcota bacterium]
MGQITTERHERIFVITMDRPERKNALTQTMYEGLNQAFDEFSSDSTLRVALIRGAGQCFTAGNDLQDFMNAPPLDSSSPVMQFLKRLAELEKPLVASVQGPAVGIGTTLLLHADLAYADQTAAFRLPFVPLGLVPEGGSSLLLPRILGHRRASELLLLGEKFGADTAREMGIVNEMVEGDVFARAMDRATALAQQAPRAVMQSKALMKAPYRDALRE